MFAGHEEGGFNGWQAAGDARSDGWPLGLQQPPMAPAVFISTPSVTSESSSDLDTESTGSFFPERSHTLGSLIGINTNAQNEQISKALMVEAHNSMVTETEQRRRSTGGQLRSRPSWCLVLGCGGSNPESLGMSPSLAHLLEEERKAAGSSHAAQRQPCNEEGEVGLQRNTLFNEGGILPPQPSGAPLKLILQHAISPSSSYLSADWNIFNSRHPHHHHAREGGAAAAASSHGRFATFWPGFCGRVGTVAGLAR